MVRVGALLCLALFLGGCASRSPLLRDTLPTADVGVELLDTPFFAQEAHQCGPAALATLMVAAGREVTPTQLAKQVYLPAREGSLQLELVAAARRQGLIPYAIDPDLRSLTAELAAGRPVLVLQNLGFDAFPVWHYAVVFGYDPLADTLSLRSGTERRKLMRASRFVSTWERSEFWGLVVLHPGEFPAEVDPDRYLGAVAAMEATGQLAAAATAYGAALERWPGDPVALLGFGNSQYGLGRLEQAKAAYQELLKQHPGHVVGYNNLAQLLADLGDYGQAEAKIDIGLALSRNDPRLRETLKATRQEIFRHRRN
ncbi:MAG: PA2778 family cysteine peptidase [Pseudomonadota bacterium]|nr:PA2778 family cysteine peptidase [Pseudomonadota bacterium]